MAEQVPKPPHLQQYLGCAPGTNLRNVSKASEADTQHDCEE